MIGREVALHVFSSSPESIGSMGAEPPESPFRLIGMRPIFVLAVAVTAVAWLPPLLFGWWWPDYSMVGDFISELGARGAPRASFVNLTFGVAGALFVGTCVAIGLTTPGWRVPLTLLSAVGISYVVAAFVPCDSGCPSVGSPSQAVHNTVGAAGYLCGGIGLWLLGKPLTHAGRPIAATLARGAGVVAIGGVIAMGSPELTDIRGAIQRLVELGAFASLLAIAR